MIDFWSAEAATILSARFGPMHINLLQALGLLLDDVEHLFAEGFHQLLGMDWADALDHARGEILLRALGSGRRCRAQEIDAIWQAFAVLLPIHTVGVMGDSRTYDQVAALRAVTSTDGMTADSYAFDHGFLSRVAARIVNEVKGINRVVYDLTSKPPGTIEWE